MSTDPRVSLCFSVQPTLDFGSTIGLVPSNHGASLLCLAVSALPLNIVSIIPIVISRFILNLRQTGERSPPPSRPSRIGTLVFRLQETIVGNMGESLNHGFEGEVEGDEGCLDEGDVGADGEEILVLQPRGSGLRESERFGFEAEDIVECLRDSEGAFAPTDA